MFHFKHYSVSSTALPCSLLVKQIDPYNWSQNARANQKLPDGDWKTWLIIAGRGFGKTRTGAESIRQLVSQNSCKRVALIGQTIDETRSVMVEGVSGILSIYPPEESSRGSLRSTSNSGSRTSSASSSSSSSSSRLSSASKSGADSLFSSILSSTSSADSRFSSSANADSIITSGPPSAAAPPLLEYAKRRMIWPNGTIAQLFSADRYDRLRGPQFDLAWIDEFAKFRHPERLYEQLMFGLRLGEHPRCIITTTPRPLPFLKELMDDKSTITTHGTTFDNQENLSPSFIDYVKKKYGNSALGRQELYADLLFEDKNALWNRRMIKYKPPNDLVRVVIAVDPAVTYNSSSDETGIVVVGKNSKGEAFVLDDLSGQFHPHAWGLRVVEAFRKYKADRIVAEVNQGGDLVEEMIRSFDATLPYTGVRATRGKFTRAEPVSALYEQGRVFHERVFCKLEEQMCNFVPDRALKSPDRMDALVWGMTELFKGAEKCGVYVWG